MTDLEQFEALLSKLPDTAWGKETPGDEGFEQARIADTIADSNCAIRVHVWPGYRAHFEAEFDATGKILNIGQWDEM